MSYADELLDTTISALNGNLPHGIASDFMAAAPGLSEKIWETVKRLLIEAADSGANGFRVGVFPSVAPTTGLTGTPSLTLDKSFEPHMTKLLVGNWQAIIEDFPLMAFDGNAYWKDDVFSMLAEEVAQKAEHNGIPRSAMRLTPECLAFDLRWLDKDKETKVRKIMTTPAAVAALKAGVPITDLIA